MRVALDVTPLAGDQTGIGTFVHELVSAFVEVSELELVGLAMTARGREEISAALAPAPGLSRPAAALSRPAPARVLRELWSRSDFPAVELLTGPVDLVHGTNYVVPPSRHAPMLVSVHDLSAWRDADLVHANSRAYPNLVARALERGAHVHAISEYVGLEIQAELGVADDRMHVVHLGAGVLPPSTAGSGRRMVGGSPYLLAVGTIEPRKDFPLLVDAFAQLAAKDPDVRLVIAGGEGWGSDDLSKRIKGHGLDSRVVRLGFVSDQQKSDLLAGAEIVVSAARYEGFGIVPLEAMAAGTPVVAVAGGAIPEVCGDAAVLVPVGDTDGLAEALTGVLADSAAAEVLVQRGRARVEQFGWQQTATSMVELYQHLIAL